MNGLPQHAYVMSEPHLSGYRVIIGYETLADAQAAQLALSKPPAREDAQPVAWRAVWSDGTVYGEPKNWPPLDGVSTYHGLMSRTIQPLYTHPAPDALRVADLWWSHDNWEVTHDNLEDAYEDATDSEMRGIVAIGRASQLDPVFAARVDLDTDGDGEPDDYEIRLFATKAEALAALQAEQKGGA